MQIKKYLNTVIELMICLLGISSVVLTFFEEYEFHENILYPLRFLTVDGTSFLVLTVILNKAIGKSRRFSGFLFFLRLAAVTTETVIFIVVLIGLVPQAPEHPIVENYHMFNMHILIPILSMIWFVLQEYVKRTITIKNCARGTAGILVYGVCIIPCILTGVIGEKNIPYSFLDIYSNPVYYTIIVLMVSYFSSLLLSFLFLKISNKKNGADTKK